jgi:hypothetical protein
MIPTTAAAEAQANRLRQLLRGAEWKTVRQGFEIVASLGENILGRFTEGVFLDEDGQLSSSAKWLKETGV